MADLTDEQVIDHLYAALDANNVDQFRLLMDEAQREGREVKLSSASNHETPTLLQRACELEEEKIAKMLLGAKVDVNEISLKNPIPPLILTVENGNVEILKLLLEHPAISDLDISEVKYGATALHKVLSKMAIFPEDMIIFDRCLDVLLNLPSINVNIKNQDDSTPLHMATHYGLDGVIIKLWNKGADPHLKNIYEETSFNSLFSSLYYTEEKVDKLIECFKLMLTFDNPNKELSQPLGPNSSVLHDLLVTWAGLVETQEKIWIFIQCLDLIIKSPSINIDIPNEDGLTPLQFAAMHNLVEAIETLLKNGASPYVMTKNGQNILHLFAFSGCLSKFNGSPAEKCDRSVKSLEIILEKFCIGENKNSIIPIINQQDKIGRTPLYNACYSESEGIVKLFLRNGAHLDEMSYQFICPATLESFFDSCIEIPVNSHYLPDSARLVPVTFNYSSLLTTPTKTKSQALPNSSTPANLIKSVDESAENNATEKSTFLQMVQDGNLSSEPKEDDIIYSESETLWYLSQFPRYRHLLDHPLVKSFLMLKWHSFRKFYWTSVAIYALFLVLFSTYILLLYSGWNHPILITCLNVLWHLVTLLNIAFFTLELLQFAMIPGAYVRTFENWIDVPLIVLTLAILFHAGEDPNSVKYLSAVAILLAWSEGLILLSKHPKFSTYVTMFSKVSISFLYLFGWFSVLLIGFAFSFFLIFGQTPETDGINSKENEYNTTNIEEKRQFINIYDTFLKSFAMMKDEYDFGDLPFGVDLAFGVTSRILFILFMFFVTIVMMNLLNGLAIYDIQDIKKQAEMYSYISQVELFATREFILLLGDPSHKLGHWTPINRILRSYSPITTTKLDKSIGIIKYLYRKAFLFYNCFPEKTSITFGFGGEIVEDDHLNEPNLNSPVPTNFQKFKLKREVLQRARQKAWDNKREADQRGNRIKTSNNTSGKLNETERLTNEVRQFVKLQKERNSMDDTINIKMDTIKSELLNTMKQQLEDGMSNIKQQHCDEMKELKQHHHDEMKELKQQLLNEFRQLLQEQNA